VPFNVVKAGYYAVVELTASACRAIKYDGSVISSGGVTAAAQTTVIQAAIAALPANGARLLLLNNTYTVTGLTLHRGVTLEGESRRGTVIQGDGVADRTLISITAGNGEEDIAIRDVEFRVRRAADVALDLNGFTQGLVENVRIFNNEGGNLGTGIKLRADDANTSVYRNLFEHVRLENLATGIELTASGTNGPNANMFAGVSILGCTTALTITANCYNNTFINLRAERTSGTVGTAVQDAGTDNVFIAPYVEFWSVGFNLSNAVRPVVKAPHIANVTTPFGEAGGAAEDAWVEYLGGVWVGELPGTSKGFAFGDNVQDVEFHWRNRSTGSALNTFGHRVFFQNGAGSKVEFGALYFKSTAVGAGAESGAWEFNGRSGGTFATWMRLAGGALEVGTVNELTAAAGVTIDGLLVKDGAVRGTVQSKSANYTMVDGDAVVLCTGGAGGMTFTLLPAAGRSGVQVAVKKVDSGVGVVTIDGNASETIDGALTYVLDQQWEWVKIVSDGTNWQVVG
jgi:hypothetical protein